MAAPYFSISAVERDTGISKEVLRVWERRYGFPAPERDTHGERLYPADQVERLLQIKRLMDQGHRPGKLISTPPEQLAALPSRRTPPGPAAQNTALRDAQDELLGLIRQHDIDGFAQAAQRQLARQGLQRFVLDIVAPLTFRVGEAWEAGRFEVFEEHLFTELTKRLLRQAIATLPPTRNRPRILLTSITGEQHGLGLLMLETLLSLEGADCIPLGIDIPLQEIVGASAAHRADIVALSFSSAFAQRQIPGALSQLRAMLPGDTDLWAGGGGVSRIAPPAGVRCFVDLGRGLEALADWRKQRGE